MTTILVCDDRDWTRRGLVTALSKADGIDRVDCVGSARLLQHYSRRPPDVVLVGTPAGARSAVAAIRLLLERHPQAEVMVFGSAPDGVAIGEAVAAGARGFLRWDSYRIHVVTSAAHPPSGGTGSASGHSQSPRPPLTKTLTQRELEILTYMSQGRTNLEIGGELFLAEDTIKSHARLIFRKLNVRDRAAAVAQGFRHNFLR